MNHLQMMNGDFFIFYSTMPRQCKWIEGDQCTNTCKIGEKWCKLHSDTVKWTENIIKENQRLVSERDALKGLQDALKEHIDTWTCVI